MRYTVSDPTEVLGLVGGTAGFATVSKYIWDHLQRRKEQLEERAELERDKAAHVSTEKLDSVLSKLVTLEVDMATLLEKNSTQIGLIAELKARVEGISANHGSRLGTAEQTLVELRTRIIGLEEKRTRK